MTLRTPAFNDARTYGFEWLRNALEVGLINEGVIGANDFLTTPAAAGLMRVDVASGRAVVKGDSGTPGAGLSQGHYLVVNDAAIPNAVTLTASNGTNPRLDQIVLRVRDTADLGSGADDALLEVVTGTATAGATLDNRNGAAALPNDAIRLADVLVPAGSTAVTAPNVRDRRPAARGTYARITGSITSTTATQALITNLAATHRRGDLVVTASRVTFQQPGDYNVDLNTYINNTAALRRGMTELRKNGSTIASAYANVLVVGADGVGAATFITTMAAGDYLELYSAHDDGANSRTIAPNFVATLIDT
jgi:hypothetical protein